MPESNDIRETRIVEHLNKMKVGMLSLTKEQLAAMVTSLYNGLLLTTGSITDPDVRGHVNELLTRTAMRMPDGVKLELIDFMTSKIFEKEAPK